jgi:hypothetical protein
MLYPSVYLYLRVLYRVCLNTKAGNRYQIIDYLQGNTRTSIFKLVYSYTQCINADLIL